MPLFSRLYTLYFHIKIFFYILIISFPINAIASTMNLYLRRCLDISIAFASDGFLIDLLILFYPWCITSLIHRCLKLRVGDMLASINGQDVLQMVHQDVVNILKSCPKGAVCEFIVRRQAQSEIPMHTKGNEGLYQHQSTSL